jgi:hypothetical protein
MKASAFNTTVLFYPNKNPNLRLFALWYFTTLMTLWNLLGHFVLGFEQSWATPIAAVTTAILVSMVLDVADAWARNRRVRFLESPGAFLNFLPACVIPGFACGMLLYANERLWPVIFAVCVSMGSKVLLRTPVGNGRYQHIFNPSNIGVATTLVLMPSVGFAPPYHFTENVRGFWDWGLPGAVLFTGIVIHALFTGRLPLVAAWIIGFVMQGLFRAWLVDAPLFVPLMPMTSAAFILFTLYMIPDPATTPLKPARQVLFGFAVAMVYGALQMLHVVFGLFFALVTVCAIRGLSLHAYFLWKKLAGSGATAAEKEPGVVGLPAQS